MDTTLHQQLQWEQHCLQHRFSILWLWIVRPLILFSPVYVRKKVNFVRSIFFFSNERSSADGSLLFVKMEHSSGCSVLRDEGLTFTIKQPISCSFKIGQPSSHLIPVLPEPAREMICMRGAEGGWCGPRGCLVAHTHLDGDGRKVCSVTWA